MTNEPYLWDMTGPPDAFIAKLERSLTARRAKAEQAGRPREPRRLQVVGPLALAAAALVLWACLGVGTEEAKTRGTDRVSPPVATTTPETGAPVRAEGALDQVDDPAMVDPAVDDPAVGDPAVDDSEDAEQAESPAAASTAR